MTDLKLPEVGPSNPNKVRFIDTPGHDKEEDFSSKNDDSRETQKKEDNLNSNPGFN